jgi:chromosome segregation ATPase
MDDASPSSAELSRELDRLSLTQALVDFEVANARVTDLTQRLVDAANEIAALKAELDRRTAQLTELDRVHRQMAESTTWKIAKGIEAVRKLLQR